MHVGHLIAVVAENEEEAQSAAECFLEDNGGNGDVWDWYAIGGRWAEMLDGKTFLQASTDPEAFKAHVNKALDKRDNEFRRLRTQYLTGEFKPEDVDWDSQAASGETKEEAAARIETDAKGAGHRERFQAVLTAHSLRDLPEEVGGNMVGFALHRIGELVAGYYSFESFFFDGEEHDADPGALWKRVEEAPEKQWLVVVDLHN
jgi:hypothetical protein